MTIEQAKEALFLREFIDDVAIYIKDSEQCNYQGVLTESGIYQIVKSEPIRISIERISLNDDEALDPWNAQEILKTMEEKVSWANYKNYEYGFKFPSVVTIEFRHYTDSQKREKTIFKDTYNCKTEITLEIDNHGHFIINDYELHKRYLQDVTFQEAFKLIC